MGFETDVTLNIGILLALACFFTRRPRLGARRTVGAGLAFGLAILTKEIMAIELLVILVFVAWARRSQIGDALRVAFTGKPPQCYRADPQIAFAT